MAKFIHPEKGIRLSPYCRIDPKRDLRLTSAQILEIPSDKNVRMWGYFDGSGEPINLTSQAYFDRFVYDRDFTLASEVHINEDIPRGASTCNVKEIYPTATRIEYYMRPTVKQGELQLDWAALTLIFEEMADQFYLVGIVHNQWTI